MASSSTKKRTCRGIVLLVDDEEQNRMLLRDPLGLSAFEVIEADNGMSALQIIDQRIPDVILLDLMMPKMDGLKSAAGSRKIGKPPTCRS